MDEEFALCWNNFQDNIATGFQNLYDGGDLVDVTLACDGKLLHAHKIVLAICSPYFQEMFLSNPCKHPIIILKDVTHTVMSELLQFMYQGVVNVKHTDLPSFMKIAQTLQIKGLATSAQKSPNSLAQGNNAISSKVAGGAGGASAAENFSTNNADGKLNSSTSGPQKRSHEFPTEQVSIFPKKLTKRTTESAENDISTESMENMSSDDVFPMPPIPQISMVDASSFYNKNVEYPNELSITSDFTKGPHMDIPAVAPGEKWCQGKLEFMLSQRGKPLLVHDGHTFGIQYIRKDKKYWQCNLSRKFNCKARVTTTESGEIIVTNNEHCHTEIRQHLRKDYKIKVDNCPFTTG